MVCPADHGGCGYYRLRWPARALAELGADVVISEEGPQAGYRLEAGTVDWVDGQPTTTPTIERMVAADADADVVVLQRPLHAKYVRMIPLLQARGIAVVVEIDDDFHALPQGHPARRETSAGHDPDHNRRWLRKACQLADLVTCTTPAIAGRYAGHNRAAVLPNCIPASYLTIEGEPHDGLRLTWTGSVHTHIRDLEAAGDAVARVVADHDVTPWIVGTGRAGHGQPSVADQLGLDRVETTGWVELHDYPAVYASADMAMVPLQRNQFNEAKSWLKGLEAAALGVPFVATPTTPYQLLYLEGAGMLADTPERWRTNLEALATSPALREQLAGAGRETAARWTVEANAWRWMEAWEHAHRRRRALRKDRVPA